MLGAPDFCEILRVEINRRMSRLDPDRYSQEPAYMGALISKLDDLFYEDDNYKLDIKGVVVADRGRGAAESKAGADFAIIVTIKKRGNVIVKALLGQAKKGSQNKINSSLMAQIGKMRVFTDDILIAQTPKNSFDSFSVRIYNYKKNSLSESMSLETYFCKYLLACVHGDRGEEFVQGVQGSNLSKLLIDFDVK